MHPATFVCLPSTTGTRPKWQGFGPLIDGVGKNAPNIDAWDTAIQSSQ